MTRKEIPMPTYVTLFRWTSQGNVQTETLRAFTEDEFRKMIAALP
jgi:uncharacterized protein with GYD domain